MKCSCFNMTLFSLHSPPLHLLLSHKSSPPPPPPLPFSSPLPLPPPLSDHMFASQQVKLSGSKVAMCKQTNIDTRWEQHSVWWVCKCVRVSFTLHLLPFVGNQSMLAETLSVLLSISISVSQRTTEDKWVIAFLIFPRLRSDSAAAGQGWLTSSHRSDASREEEDGEGGGGALHLILQEVQEEILPT